MRGWLLVGYGVGGHLTHDAPRKKLAKAKEKTGAPPLAPRHVNVTISRYSKQQVYIVKTRKNNAYCYQFD